MKENQDQTKFTLETRNISKAFIGTVALDDVSVSFDSGRIHALIGKNGSGKSTLTKVLSGVYAPTSGEVYLYGEKIEHSTPELAIKKGIAEVYQELSLFQDLSVGENIFAGKLPMKSRMSVDWKALHSRSKALLQNLGLEIDTHQCVRDLSVSQQQLVEITKGMSFEPKVLILDEPTSALSASECRVLFDVLRKLKETGIIIIYITHRLHELPQIADTVTILRDGKHIVTGDLRDIPPAKMVAMMFGEVMEETKPVSNATEKIVLKVEHLSNNKLRDVGFHLKEGEILGIAGMMGSGRTELLRAIFGLDPLNGGRIKVCGKTVKKVTPQQMKQHGVGYTSEHRKRDGLCLKLSIASNLCVASLYDITKNGRIDKFKERQYIRTQIEELQIKVADINMPVQMLSGGNQQKVVIGNWLNTKPKVMLLDEPARGIDVNAKQQMFNIIWSEARKGTSFVFVSSELEELLGVCDRIVIMRDGQIHGELSNTEFNIQDLYARCLEVLQ